MHVDIFACINFHRIAFLQGKIAISMKNGPIMYNIYKQIFCSANILVVGSKTPVRELRKNMYGVNISEFTIMERNANTAENVGPGNLLGTLDPFLLPGEIIPGIHPINRLNSSIVLNRQGLGRGLCYLIMINIAFLKVILTPIVSCYCYCGLEHV